MEVLTASVTAKRSAANKPPSTAQSPGEAASLLRLRDVLRELDALSITARDILED
jgi:hypothetical protein